MTPFPSIESSEPKKSNSELNIARTSFHRKRQLPIVLEDCVRSAHPLFFALGR
jgi:hypothetical protein